MLDAYVYMERLYRHLKVLKHSLWTFSVCSDPAIRRNCFVPTGVQTLGKIMMEQPSSLYQLFKYCTPVYKVSKDFFFHSVSHTHTTAFAQPSTNTHYTHSNINNQIKINFLHFFCVSFPYFLLIRYSQLLLHTKDF